MSKIITFVKCQAKILVFTKQIPQLFEQTIRIYFVHIINTKIKSTNSFDPELSYMAEDMVTVKEGFPKKQGNKMVVLLNAWARKGSEPCNAGALNRRKRSISGKHNLNL